MFRQTGFSIALTLLTLSTVATGAAEAYSRGGHRGGYRDGHHGEYRGGHHGQQWYWRCSRNYPKPICYRVRR